MKYYGGKNKIGNELSDAMIAYLKKIDCKYTTFIEPFCGSLGLTKYMVLKCPHLNFFASDSNKSLIMLYQYIKKNNNVPRMNISQKEYYELKSDEHPSVKQAIAGIIYSYCGGWFNGYCVNNGSRNYVVEGFNTLEKLIPVIKKIQFCSLSYEQFSDVKGSIIYCDPPYKNSIKRYHNNNFDSIQFWDFIRHISKYNIVFVSETSAPKDFKCIWKKTFYNKSGVYSVERDEGLFISKR